MLLLALTISFGYLLGSLPFGFLVARAKGVNIFEVGSKNPGATNVRRVLGLGPGNLVLFLDALKGALAAAVGCFHLTISSKEISFNFHNVNTAGSLEELLPPIAGLIAAVLGHSFSCFTGFKGGKGVATGAGGFFVLFPSGAVIALVIYVLCVVTTRYVSLGSMLGTASLPISALVMHRSTVLVGMSALIALFVIVRHRANISRLLAGTEAKAGQNVAATPTAPKP